MKHPALFTTAALFLSLLQTSLLPAQTTVDTDTLEIYERLLMERITVVSTPAWKTEIPGAASYVNSAELERQGYTDIHRVLRHVAGVNIQEEDGFGLRPNIGLRGAGMERSTKINLMEDGVLIAPAPYSAPAAYYFPSVGRMSAVEVRKGSAQIKYGPNTTGGAINMITTRIPHRLTGKAEASVGEFGSNKLHANIGTSGRNFGFLIEGMQMRNDGFKQLDGGGDTGFRIYDFMGKAMARTNPDAPVYQRFELKAGFYDEISDETYLGLSRADFESNPLRRYAGSREDRMDARHLHLMGRHFMQFSERFDITTTLYRNSFTRDWYKLQSVDGLGLSSVLNDPEAYVTAFGYLRGADSPENTLIVRSNNREYLSQGIESIFALNLGPGSVDNQFELGVRIHQDEEDRFQYEDGYRMQSGRMILTDAGVPGTQANRIGSATALSFFLKDKISYGNWTFTPGVRLENIWFESRNYGAQDLDRTGSQLSANDYTVNVIVPGAGVTYGISDRFTLIAGIHKGFSPPSPGSANETRSEESINYETGFRYGGSVLNGEVIGFFNDYQNLLGSDLAAGGGGGTTAQFNAGKVRVFGLELSATLDLTDLELFSGLPFALPLSANYTFTDASFRSDFESRFDPWGAVASGDKIPFIPVHQFNAALGILFDRLELNLNATTMDRMRTRAGSGPLDETFSTDGYFLLDVSTSYRVTAIMSAFLSVRNLLDSHYIVSDRPAGVRPGLPRMLTGGIRLSI